MSIYVCLFPEVGHLLQEPVVLRLSGQRRGEKDSLSAQTFTLLQPPSVPNVTSTQSPWLSSYGK